MRVDVGQLLKDPIGTRVDVVFDSGYSHIAGDLAVNAIRGRANLLRTAEGIWVGGRLAVDIDLQCVRCLNPVTETIQVELDERFRHPPFKATEDHPVLSIDADKYIDIRPVLRELVIVSTPMRVVCRQDCLGLCPECGQDLNNGACDCQPDEIDPRLAALKALLNDGVEE
jgi:uncharacterized protein